jgi:DNA-binding XRE family transcriptional regulator
MNVTERVHILMNKIKPPGVFPSGNTESSKSVESNVARAARQNALRFGKLIRERREALGMRQDDLALSTGVGRRFVIELEAGKPGCQLGKSLVVATAVGLRPFDMTSGEDNALLPDLPDTENPHG